MKGSNDRLDKLTGGLFKTVIQVDTDKSVWDDEIRHRIRSQSAGGRVDELHGWFQRFPSLDGLEGPVIVRPSDGDELDSLKMIRGVEARNVVALLDVQACDGTMFVVPNQFRKQVFREVARSLGEVQHFQGVPGVESGRSRKREVALVWEGLWRFASSQAEIHDAWTVQHWFNRQRFYAAAFEFERHQVFHERSIVVTMGPRNPVFPKTRNEIKN